MSLEEKKRLYKHYMGTMKADGTPKPQQLVEADRIADKARLFYDKEGKPKKLGSYAKDTKPYENQEDSYDLVKAIQEEARPVHVAETKSKGKK